MEQKSIDKIAEEVEFGDLIMLKLPSSVQAHYGEVSGNDYAVGFFEKIDNENIYINHLQKIAYSDQGAFIIPIESIESYEILRKYVPDPEDKIDNMLQDLLDNK